MKKNENNRFEQVYVQGKLTSMEIWVDKETGVNYLYAAGSYGGGVTPLLNRDGTPVVTTVIPEKD